MIIHVAENGQRVSFPTAESSEVKGGFIRFYDQNGLEVGRQPVVEPEVAPEPSETPQEPPVEPPPPSVAVEVPEPPKED